MKLPVKKILSYLFSLFQYFRSMLFYYIKGLYHKIDDQNTFLLSGGLAFSFFTCILPMILIVFSFIGIVMAIPEVTDQITRVIDTLVPYHRTANYIEKIIFERIHEFKILKTVTGIIGIIGLLFAASGLFSSMRTILNLTFQVKEIRNVLIGKLRDLGMVLLVIAFFLLLMSILPVLDILVSFTDKFELFNLIHLGDIIGYFLSVAVSLISFILVFIMFGLIYYLIPYARLPIKVVTIGAFWASLFWSIAKELFGYYITHAVTLSRIYGAYVFLVIVAFWIYYSSFIFIVGAEIGQLYRERIALKKSENNRSNN